MNKRTIQQTIGSKTGNVISQKRTSNRIKVGKYNSYKPHDTVFHIGEPLHTEEPVKSITTHIVKS
jgi:hypothetical protein